ncbi:MAG: hypothetical protein OEZ44_07540 [Candidatus Bathyarchaeota archaeon]|nr:hypothetical protein [Candidatus Bathyarchaeota archaeon]
MIRSTRSLPVMPDLSPKIIEIAAYFLAILGMLGDQISTRLGLASPGTCELNFFAAWMMARGLWLPLDLLLLAAFLCTPAVLIRRYDARERWLTLAYPILFGLIRITAAISNFMIIFTLGL